LAALNAAPEGLKHSVVTELTEKADKGWRADYGAMGELVGGVTGGFTKSIAG